MCACGNITGSSLGEGVGGDRGALGGKARAMVQKVHDSI